MPGRKILRVPLYAQRKAVRAFHRLHKAVRRVCRRRKARRNVPHRLVVKRVALVLPRPHDTRQQAVRRQRQAVEQFAARRTVLIMADGRPALRGDVLPQRAAECHVQHLCAAADAQQRLFMLRRGAAQRQLHVVAQAVGAGELGHRALAVIGGRNVAAARQHKAAAQRQPLSHARAHGVGRGGQQQRKAARAFHRAHVIVPCGIGGVHLPRAGRDDPDYRLHAFTLPFGAAQALRPHAHILSIALFHCCWPCVKASVGGVLERAGTALR